ncbi:MAG TPA: EscU/YscU/HrcU family type III secretion system export apparatus switch protein, partial [Allosphingosinicella sp.]|nr:EscU/YscU/HrcU family type III secretion system export apparatus switch protein [Allosphingosinicella sp.]
MENAEQDRSEQATPFKLQSARKKGSVARGMDLGFLVVLAFFLLYIWIAGDSLGEQLTRASREAIVTAPDVVGGSSELLALSGHVFGAMLQPLGLFAISLFATVLLFELLQTGIVFSAQPLKADFSRLNPAKGLKRIFSKRMLIETFKNVLKFAVYVGITWLVLRRELDNISSSAADAASLAQAIFRATLRLLACFALAALFFAAIDQLIVRKEFSKNMRMSRRELRREVRDREGEPRLKQKRKQLHAEFVAASQSLRNVKDADVVVTNPSHYAVALRYDSEAMAAPIVVSRGSNALARRIKRLA